MVKASVKRAGIRDEHLGTTLDYI